MEPTDIRDDVAIFVNFNQGPRQVRDFRLHVTWIFKEMTEVEEKLSLHPTNKIGQVVLRRTETAQPAEGVPDASVRLRRTRCSVRDRPFNPRRITFVNYFEAAGPAWPGASTLPAPRVAGVPPGQLRFAFVRRVHGSPRGRGPSGRPLLVAGGGAPKEWRRVRAGCTLRSAVIFQLYAVMGF